LAAVDRDLQGGAAKHFLVGKIEVDEIERRGAGVLQRIRAANPEFGRG
jgi:hypothetical protein